MTSRVAYWAGGMDILNRGEPVSIPRGSADEMFAVVTKAACLQAVHRGAHIEFQSL